MNRIVLIGNGFDLAHGLPTRYEDFINWYWEQRVQEFRTTYSNHSKDPLCTFSINNENTWSGLTFSCISRINKTSAIDIIKAIRDNKDYFKTSISPFFENICKSIETKGWVDIENEYYKLLTKYAIEEPSSERLNELNAQLEYIQCKLAIYLSIETKRGIYCNERLLKKLYEPIKPNDISVESRSLFENYIYDCKHRKIEYWREKLSQYGLKEMYLHQIEDYIKSSDTVYHVDYPYLFMLPDMTVFVNFNYTNTADSYIRFNQSDMIHVHGDLNDPKKMIFGYGDEIDSKYLQLQNLNDNECLKNIKSIKYLESDNYRNVLSFIDSAPYQIYIMGHSCGNSDRTLLNTLFEHKNCISIKPYYYKKEDGTDNYLELVMNISRNFTDMKLMRDRVVNKTFCETLLG